MSDLSQAQPARTCTCGKGDDKPAIYHAEDCPCVDWVSGYLEGSVTDDPRIAIRRADEAASVAHDFIYGKNAVTKEQASAAIWTIHYALRPLFEETDLGY